MTKDNVGLVLDVFGTFSSIVTFIVFLNVNQSGLGTSSMANYIF